MEGNAYHGEGEYTYESGDVLKCAFEGSNPSGSAEYKTAQGKVINGVYQDGLFFVVVFCFYYHYFCVLVLYCVW